MFRVLNVLVIVVLLLPGVLFVYVNFPMEYHTGSVKEFTLTVPRGSSLMSVVQLLEKESILKDHVWAYYYGRLLSFVYKGIHSGSYLVSTSMTSTEIMNALFQGKTLLEYVVLTVPEGYNIYNLSELFVSKNLVRTRREFLRLVFDPELIRAYQIEGNSLEGYLYPTTYYISPQDSAKNVLVRMLDTFQQVFPSSYFQQYKGSMDLNRHQLVTLASLIEKETSVDAERKLVSSVFHNRLRRNMRMACDPTIIYALLRSDRYQGTLSRKRGDLDVLSPYNTYLYKGLPPSPIANPGRASIEAALHPGQSEYLFFVAQDEKNHAFARSFQEHNQNVQHYKQWLYNRRNESSQ